MEMAQNKKPAGAVTSRSPTGHGSYATTIISQHDVLAKGGKMNVAKLAETLSLILSARYGVDVKITLEEKNEPINDDHDYEMPA